jgi:hypothetical protein
MALAAEKCPIQVQAKSGIILKKNRKFSREIKLYYTY